MAESKRDNGNLPDINHVDYNENLWTDAVVQQEVLTTPNRDIDFDQFNDENNTYTRFGNIHQQQSQNIIQEEVDLGTVQNKFQEITEENEKERMITRKAKQVSIGTRLTKIRE